MARNILMKIRETQEEIEHAITLFRVWVIGACLEVIHDGEGIGK
jgi:hypothetical protein